MTLSFCVLDPPPENVRITSCEAQTAEIQWEHGSDDVINYVIEYWPGPGYDGIEMAKVSGESTSVVLDLWPGEMYRAFHIYAETPNGRSESVMSDGDDCITPPEKPTKNPTGVCGEAGKNDELTITWEVNNLLSQSCRITVTGCIVIFPFNFRFNLISGDSLAG